MSTTISTIPNYTIEYFHRIPIGGKLRLSLDGDKLTKTSRGYAHDGSGHIRIYPQKLVFLVTEEEVSWEELDFHTFDFTAVQLAEVIGRIVQRVADDYPTKNIDGDRLRKGLYAAHRAKPIRFIALLHACALDFPTDVIMGVYRHYDPSTDSIKGGWTAQHAEAHKPDIFDLLFGRL